MWGYPGKKLLFMGQEMAPWTEWSEARSLDWHLLDHAPHKGMQSLVRDLNRIYRALPALHARDCEPEGFDWLIADDNQNSVYAWARHSGGGDPAVVVVSNFTPVPREGYVLPLPRAGRWREIAQQRCRSLWRQRAGQHGRNPGRGGSQPWQAGLRESPLAAAGNFVFPV